MTENTGANQVGRFRKGESGNPAGKPKGARHKLTVLAEKLMADDAEAIVRKVVEAAKGGDLTAARLVLDRIAPARRDNPVSFDLPEITTAAEASKVIAALLAAVGMGEVTPSEAIDISRIVEAFTKAHELSELESRIAALEERQKDGK